MNKKSPVTLTSLEDKIKMLEKKLAMSNASFLNIVGRSLDAIIILDQSRMVVYANYAALNLFDKSITELLGEPFHIAFDMTSTGEIEIPRNDASKMIAEITVIETEWNNKPSYLASFRDITERKESEAMLKYLSEHDYLTDLPNRVYFEKKLSESIHTARDAKLHMALLYIDLDNFKKVNDTMGHSMGDKLLKHVSTLLNNNIRHGDLAARLGGDEFAVILDSIGSPEYAGTIAKKLLKSIAACFELEGKDLFPNASIGIAVYPMGGTSTVELIKNADAAMYSSKKHGKNQFRYFTQELNKQNAKELEIMSGLANLDADKELILEYQPIIELQTKSIFGVEALLRWNHPNLGRLMPDAFIPYAEDASLMMPIGRWVMEKGLSEYKQLKNCSIFLSVNMSVTELDGSRIADNILKIIEDMNIGSDEIILELTETAVMKHPETAIKKLDLLASKGMKIAIDDYGTGYSSLSYLKQLPVSLLKIDGSFVRDIGKDENDTVIVQSTIKLAHNLGLKVIAEGIETKEQCDFLQKNGCDYGQGYYFARPMSIDKLVNFKVK
jgi:diguanylate cyclase (GGDEF)-like protein